MAETVRNRPWTKAEQETEVERVYRILKGWLVEARLAPGEFLSEHDLAARLKTSRTPIREAFGRLAQDGWLTRIRRKGYLVTPVSIREIVELYEFRKILECFAVEKVAQSAGENQIDELAGIVGIETNPQVDLASILAANSAFHMKLAELSSNQRVINQLGLVLCYVQRFDTICTQKIPGWVGHEEIVAALKAHHAAAAGQAMARHIELSRDKMLKLFAA